MSKLTNKEFVNKIITVLNRTDVKYWYWGTSSTYELTNKKEFCYYDGTNLLVSPSGLVKSILYDPNIVNNKTKKNYAQWNPSEVKIGTYWTAFDIVNEGCSETSMDFSSIPYGAVLIKGLLDNQCGVYVGNGKVIEVTTDWNANTIVMSEVDTTGGRSYQTLESGLWNWWGKLTDVDYTYTPAEEAERSISDNTYGNTIIDYSGNTNGIAKYSPNALYTFMVYDGSESSLDVRPTYKDLGLSTTVINAGNKYYIADKNGECWNDSVTINNRNIDGMSSLYYLTCKNAKALDNLTYNGNYRSRLANCVGYARGRVFELWGQLIDHQVIIESGGKLVVPTMDNLEIKGDIYIPNKRTGTGKTKIPNSNAKNIADNWSSAEGFGIGNEPKVGSIICWSSSKYGHVAFVEAVENRGQSDEYIIVSESGWSTYGANTVSWLEKIKKYNSNGTYAYRAGYNLKGFCYTPLCQLFGDNPTSALVHNTITIDWKEITAEDIMNIAKVKESLANTRVTKELSVGDRVKVEWFGYKSPSADENDRSQRINISGAEGKVLKIESDKPFKYAISTDGNTICGYFDRKALALLE